jgi:class 3 adenylate cyclase
MEPRSSPSGNAAGAGGRQSRTNGFLFADLRGYTQFVESHGDRAAAGLLDVYRQLVRAEVLRFQGAEIKTEGDSFYVVFPSVGAAVECGLAIVQAAAEASTRDRPIRVGIGVHAGETVETDEGYVGSAVNVAARVCSQARAGEVLVTDTVRALTRTALPVRFTDRRTKRLKGVAEPVVLYTATPAAGIAVSVAGRSRLLPTARVVVLLVGLLIGGAASGYLLVAATRSPGPASQPPGASPSAEATSLPPSVAFPNLEEQDLLDFTPTEVRESCDRAGGAEALTGATASVRCDLALASEAETVWYHRFPSGQALASSISGLVVSERLPLAECNEETPRAQGNWRVGSTHSGRLLCYQGDGQTWILWSYEAERVLARAVRTGDTEADWLGMHKWWRQIRLFAS